MRLDRLARSTRDLLNVLDAVGKAGTGFRSVADSWAAQRGLWTQSSPEIAELDG